MPDIASWASGRHQPPVLSAGRAIVALPPSVGLPSFCGTLGPTVVAPPEGDLALLPPHAAISMAMMSAMATAPPTLRLRDPRTDLTFPPNGYEAGSFTGMP